jgi:hypothetical protein
VQATSPPSHSKSVTKQPIPALPWHPIPNESCRMSIDLPVETLCLSHQGTDQALSVSTSLCFRGSDVCISQIYSLTCLRKYWIFSNRTIPLKIRVTNGDRYLPWSTYQGVLQRISTSKVCASPNLPIDYSNFKRFGRRSDSAAGCPANLVNLSMLSMKTKKSS